MKLLTRDTDYAMRALCFIARHKDRLVPGSELARELAIPYPFLRKILQTLNRKKILRSFKGKGGGFKLSIKPDRIFLFDLIRIFQGPVKLNQCVLSDWVCQDRASCLLKGKIDQVEKYVVAELKSITIAALINQEG